MKLEKSLGLEITKYNEPKEEGGKLIKYELLRHQHEKVEYPRLDEEIFGRKFIYQTNTIINLHNHSFWESD